MTGMSLSAGMLLAHVVATGLLVLVLARGEAALWALADWLRFRVRAFSVRPWVPEPGGSPSPIIDGDVPVLLEQPGSRFTRRGPPVSAAA
jgi:hypothetical protein